MALYYVLLALYAVLAVYELSKGDRYRALYWFAAMLITFSVMKSGPPK